MPEVAAREAYMAAFHAAQACLFERDGRSPKTHSGVHAAFGLLAAHEPVLGRRLGSFLPRAYNLKDISDYSTTRTVSEPQAGAAIRAAADFLAAVEAYLGIPPDTAPG